jgi:hypothetical protein
VRDDDTLGALCKGLFHGLDRDVQLRPNVREDWCRLNGFDRIQGSPTEVGGEDYVISGTDA